MMQDILHRRAHPRLRLGVEARLIGLDGTQDVILQDLSCTGAKLLLERAEHISQGVLRWMDFEAFGDVTWRKGRWCGIAFDELLPEDVLHATRQAAPALLKQPAERLRRHARTFALGEDSSEDR
ncbi:PilZ domain-containing protein [Porphyrobacter sp. GA68]|uniref:PilZ domain-containing protein n=1 Tax=Porphyrobacter sp. GA68 TaxID=2883480 RepID=UPI001D1945E0|nr:PilZ domain-containing protein [Porphyrobacter sp. GA68]